MKAFAACAVGCGLLLVGCGIAGKRLGSKATQGMTTELREQMEATPPEKQGVLAEGMIKGAVRGGLDELSKPERQEQLADAMQLAANRMAAAMADAMVTRLAKDLGPDLAGPLSEAITASSQRATTAVLSGVKAEAASFFGPCEGANSFTCLTTRVHDLGQAASRGFIDGVKWPLFLVVFLMGFLMRAAVHELSVVFRNVGRWIGQKRTRRHAS